MSCPIDARGLGVEYQMTLQFASADNAENPYSPATPLIEITKDYTGKTVCTSLAYVVTASSCFLLARFHLGELLLGLLACQFQDILPLNRGNGGNAEAGLLEHLHVFQWLPGLGVRLQVREGDLLAELAAIFDVHDNPFRVISLGLGVVVGVFGIEGRFCRSQCVRDGSIQV